MISAHEDNRKSWDAATARHRSHKPDLVSQYVKDGWNNLFPEEMSLMSGGSPRPALGAKDFSLEGKNVLHLQCNDGQDTVSTALHLSPASIVGVDISDSAIRFAEELSTAVQGMTSTKIKFVREDVVRFCEEFEGKREGDSEFPGSFDVVLSSYGTVGWISDIDRWASGIAKVLAPGGRFVLVDFHNVMTALDHKAPYGLIDSMIGSGHLQTDGVGDYIANDYDGVWKNPHKAHEYMHGCADIITALLKTKALTLESFTEYDYVNGWQCLDGMQPRFSPEVDPACRQYIPPQTLPKHIPLMYSIVATKQ